MPGIPGAAPWTHGSIATCMRCPAIGSASGLSCRHTTMLRPIPTSRSMCKQRSAPNGTTHHMGRQAWPHVTNSVRLPQNPPTDISIILPNQGRRCTRRRDKRVILFHQRILRFRGYVHTNISTARWPGDNEMQWLKIIANAIPILALGIGATTAVGSSDELYTGLKHEQLSAELGVQIRTASPGSIHFEWPNDLGIRRIVLRAFSTETDAQAWFNLPWRRVSISPSAAPDGPSIGDQFSWWRNMVHPE